jgi:hypothetical protein
MPQYAPGTGVAAAPSPSSTAVWAEDELARLDDAMVKHPAAADPGAELARFIKLAQHVRTKSVRDIAYRVKLKERTHNSAAGQTTQVSPMPLPPPPPPPPPPPRSQQDSSGEMSPASPASPYQGRIPRVGAGVHGIRKRSNSESLSPKNGSAHSSKRASAPLLPPNGSSSGSGGGGSEQGSPLVAAGQLGSSLGPRGRRRRMSQPPPPITIPEPSAARTQADQAAQMQQALSIAVQQRMPLEQQTMHLLRENWMVIECMRACAARGGGGGNRMPDVAQLSAQFQANFDAILKNTDLMLEQPMHLPLFLFRPTQPQSQPPQAIPTPTPAQPLAQRPQPAMVPMQLEQTFPAGVPFPDRSPFSGPERSPTGAMEAAFIDTSLI